MRKQLLASVGALTTAAVAGTATLLIGGSSCSTCAQAVSYPFGFAQPQPAASVPVVGTTGSTGSYGRLTVTTPGPDASTAVLDYTGVVAFLLGLLGANVNAPTFTTGPVSVQLDAATAATTTTTPSYTTTTNGGTVGSFGMFNMLGMPAPSSFAQGIVDVQVPLTNTSGTWADAASVLLPNAMGDVAAVGEATPLGQPFFAAAPASGATADPVVVAEPPTWMLLGAGCVFGLGICRLLPRWGWLLP